MKNRPTIKHTRIHQAPKGIKNNGSRWKKESSSAAIAIFPMEMESLSGFPYHGLPGLSDFRTFNIFVKGHEPVNHTAGGNLNNSVYQAIYELMVMGGEKNNLIEFDQAVV